MLNQTKPDESSSTSVEAAFSLAKSKLFVNCPSLNQQKPLDVPIQIPPDRLRATEWTELSGSPCSVENRKKRLFFRCSKPSFVPTQSVPSESSASTWQFSETISGVLPLLKQVNWTPSNRAIPNRVPIQM